ncbi:MAG TPA: substrate-binding domain-containing protein [Hyphomicrobiales bacterium]|nr:substrate-binding domain-containing protein [Hyphomicrobiales bacterium]
MRARSVSTLASLAVTFFVVSQSVAAEIKVMISGGFSAAYRQLVPQFEKTSGHKVETAFGPSMGATPEAIPNRIDRGEPVDVVIMVRSALDGLAAKGKVIPESRADLAKSIIAAAVKEGAPKPDIGSLEAFKRTLLAAKSIAYSDSASGVYISTEMFKKLGIEDDVKPKSRMIPAEPVGRVVARGEAEIGFQQMSELLPVPGITVIGPIPAEVQKVTVFSAGIAAGSKEQAAAKQLIAYLSSPEAKPVISSTGMTP